MKKKMPGNPTILILKDIKLCHIQLVQKHSDATHCQIHNTHHQCNKNKNKTGKK